MQELLKKRKAGLAVITVLMLFSSAVAILQALFIQFMFDWIIEEV